VLRSGRTIVVRGRHRCDRDDQHDLLGRGRVVVRRRPAA
jgi:hypothetical protein